MDFFKVANIDSARASLTISLTISLRVAGPLDPPPPTKISTLKMLIIFRVVHLSVFKGAILQYFARLFCCSCSCSLLN